MKTFLTVLLLISSPALAMPLHWKFISPQSRGAATLREVPTRCAMENVDQKNLTLKLDDREVEIYACIDDPENPEKYAGFFSIDHWPGGFLLYTGESYFNFIGQHKRLGHLLPVENAEPHGFCSDRASAILRVTFPSGELRSFCIDSIEN